MLKAGRNDPCPCGSGKKYKKCCLDGHAATVHVDAVAEAEVARAAAEAEDREGDGELDEGEYDEDEHDPDCPHCAELEAMPPYVELKECESEDEGEGRCLPGEVAERDKDAILADLEKLGIHVSPEQFLEHAKGKTSAWAISDDWVKALAKPDLGQRDRDFLGLAACELWKRLSPDRPSEEMLVDLIDEGYELLPAEDEDDDEGDEAEEEPGNESGNEEEAVSAWHKAWSALKSIIPPEVRSVAELEKAFTVLRVYEWIDDFMGAQMELAAEDPAKADPAIAFSRELLERFPAEEESWRVVQETEIADLHHMANRDAEADALLQDLLRRFPERAVPAISASDWLVRAGKLVEAMAPLRTARTRVKDEHELEVLDHCIEDLERKMKKAKRPRGKGSRPRGR